MAATTETRATASRGLFKLSTGSVGNHMVDYVYSMMFVSDGEEDREGGDGK